MQAEAEPPDRKGLGCTLAQKGQCGQQPPASGPQLSPGCKDRPQARGPGSKPQLQGTKTYPGAAPRGAHPPRLIHAHPSSTDGPPGPAGTSKARASAGPKGHHFANAEHWQGSSPCSVKRHCVLLLCREINDVFWLHVKSLTALSEIIIYDTRQFGMSWLKCREYHYHMWYRAVISCMIS